MAGRARLRPAGAARCRVGPGGSAMGAHPGSTTALCSPSSPCHPQPTGSAVLACTWAGCLPHGAPVPGTGLACVRSSAHAAAGRQEDAGREELTRPRLPPAQCQAPVGHLGHQGAALRYKSAGSYLKMQALGPANWLSLGVSQKPTCARAEAKASRSYEGLPRSGGQGRRPEPQLSSAHDCKARQVAVGAGAPQPRPRPLPLVEVRLRVGQSGGAGWHSRVSEGTCPSGTQCAATSRRRARACPRQRPGGPWLGPCSVQETPGPQGSRCRSCGSHGGQWVLGPSPGWRGDEDRLGAGLT